MNIPPDALQFAQTPGGLFESRIPAFKRPADDKTIVVKELQLVGVDLGDRKVSRIPVAPRGRQVSLHHRVDVAVTPSRTPDAFAKIRRLHVRNLARTLVLLILCTTAAGAEEPPNFAGTWTFNSEKTLQLITARTGVRPTGPSGTISADGGFVGARITQPTERQEQSITQTLTALTVERNVSTERQKYVYALDGTESVNTNGTSTLTTTSRWTADGLVTEGVQVTVTAGGTITNTFKEVRRLDADGAMVVETVRSFNGDAQSTTIQVLLKKM